MTTLLLNFLNWVTAKNEQIFGYKSRSKAVWSNIFYLHFLALWSKWLGLIAFQGTNIVRVDLHRRMYLGRWRAWLLCVLFIPSMSFEPQELKSYFLLTGAYGPEYWVTSSVSCGGHQQSPIDISDQHAHVSEEYQDLQLDGFDNESSNKTWMKNTGKTGTASSLPVCRPAGKVSLVCTLTMICSFSCARSYKHIAEWELWIWSSV